MSQNLQYIATSNKAEIRKICKLALTEKLYSRTYWDLHYILSHLGILAEHLAVCVDTDNQKLIGISVIEPDYDSICSFVKPAYRRQGIGSNLVHILVLESGANRKLSGYRGRKDISHKFWTSLGFVQKDSVTWTLKPEDLICS